MPRAQAASEDSEALRAGSLSRHPAPSVLGPSVLPWAACVKPSVSTAECRHTVGQFVEGKDEPPSSSSLSLKARHFCTHPGWVRGGWTLALQ